MRDEGRPTGTEQMVPIWRKTRLAVRGITALALVLATTCGTSIAASAATNYEATVTNTARLAEPLQIRLDEPAWCNGKDEDGNGIPDIAQAAIPKQAIPKDPRVTNESSTAAWVIMTVSIPAADVRLSAGDHVEASERCELFSFEADTEHWELIDRVDEGRDSVQYAFAYATPLESDDETAPLFDGIVLRDVVDGDLAAMRAQSVIVTAHGIQATGFDDPASAWQAYTEQEGALPKGGLR